MTIAGIRLSHLHKNEHFQFIQDVITQVEEATPAALRVEEQFAALTAAQRADSKLDIGIKNFILSQTHALAVHGGLVFLFCVYMPFFWF